MCLPSWDRKHFLRPCYASLPNKRLSVCLNLIYVAKMDLIFTSSSLFVSSNHPTLHILSRGCLIFSCLFLQTQVHIDYVLDHDKLMESIWRISSVSRNWGIVFPNWRWFISLTDFSFFLDFNKSWDADPCNSYPKNETKKEWNKRIAKALWGHFQRWFLFMGWRNPGTGVEGSGPESLKRASALLGFTWL